MVKFNQALVARRLQWDRIELRAVSSCYDALVYDSICHDADTLRRYLPWIDQIQSLADMKLSQRRAAEQFIHFHDELRYLIFDHDLDSFAGVLSLIKLDGLPFSLGYWLRQKATGQGYMTESIHLLEDYVHRFLQINDLQIRVAASNGPSRRVAERCGYRLLEPPWPIIRLGEHQIEDKLVIYQKRLV
ncbi:MAG: hypothetical protein CENE_03632 [Candidatus Celerinatantimonas neptuna]|nr:MAG: hypothetical protein CENE_03632 [Candidatus Celerinatantimonas neptuna]